MRSHPSSQKLGLLGGFLLLIAVLVIGWNWLSPKQWLQASPAEFTELPRAKVERVNLAVTLNAPGRVESRQNTLIECMLEQVRARAAGGQRMSTTGISTIIDIMPEGSIVKKGDVICRFDAAEYEEMVLQQSIVVETARSDLRQAQLDLETAEINLKEYKEGTRESEYRTFEGQIALAESELQRQIDRMQWAERLLPLGYISNSRFEQERQLLERSEINLQRSRDALKTYKGYTEKKVVQQLESTIQRLISTYEYLNYRLKREEDQLASHKEQLENCTIEAPHDGMLIYANDDDDDPKIQIGSQVTYKMDLFLLPNLEQMEVQTVLNETVVRHVQAGMPTTVRVEALPGVEFIGKVVKVSNLPETNRSWREPDIKEYIARVEIVNPEGLLPGMNAEVDIRTDQTPSSLVVPAVAVAIEDGQNYCYVTGARGIERRPVTIERGTMNLLQITSGLEEGEQVVLDPTRINQSEIRVLDSPSPVHPASLVLDDWESEMTLGEAPTASLTQ